MRKALLAALVLGLGASTAGAQPKLLRGSDTLFIFTTELINICEPNITSAELVYAGGGSSLGEGEIEADNQQIAPMSRFIDGPSCTAAGALGQGCPVALDGLAIFADDTETAAQANTCNTIRYSGFLEVTDQNGIAGIDDGAGGGCPTCVDGPDADAVADDYQFTDWRDVLRIVYGGQHAHINVPACQEADPSRSALNQKFCNSDVRHSLVNSWGNLFEEGAGCMGADPDACVSLKHAFRRDDVSGTTDSFLSLLALPAVSTGNRPSIVKQAPFCNGFEQEDEDPIRRVCSGDGSTDGEQVCQSVPRSLRGPKTPSGWYGGPTGNPATVNEADLGLVLAMVIPPAEQGPYADNNFCLAGPSGGPVRYAPMPPGIGAAQQKCPDGNARVGAQCQWPVRNLSTGGVAFGCVNRKLNRPGARTIANMDGRVYNLIPRNADGTIKTVPRVDLNTDIEAQVQVVNSMFRIHQTRVMAGGTAQAPATGCQEPDATEQIGCLVHASPCSLGFAGLTADQLDPNKALALRTPAIPPAAGAGAVLPEEDAVRRLNDPKGTGCEAAGDYDLRYPLSRVLYINTVKGFETAADPDRDFNNITNVNREQDLIKCACDRFYADQAADFAGFIPLTELAAGQCDSAGEGGVCDAPIRSCL